jgi:LmbE family N-acetylglucosaminyl deacetylase
LDLLSSSATHEALRRSTRVVAQLAVALDTSLGHEVTILYLTRGEAGIEGRTLQEAAMIPTGEAEKACAILKARQVFAGQIDGDTEVESRPIRSF